MGEQFLGNDGGVDWVLEFPVVVLVHEEQLQNKLVVGVGHHEQHVLALINVGQHAHLQATPLLVLHRLLLNTQLLVHNKLLLLFLPGAQVPHFYNTLVALTYQEITVLRMHRFKYVYVCGFVLFVRLKLFYYLEKK